MALVSWEGKQQFLINFVVGEELSGISLIEMPSSAIYQSTQNRQCETTELMANISHGEGVKQTS